MPGTNSRKTTGRRELYKMIDDIASYASELNVLDCRKKEARKAIEEQTVRLRDACPHETVLEYISMQYDDGFYASGPQPIGQSKHRQCLVCGFDDAVERSGGYHPPWEDFWPQFNGIVAPKTTIFFGWNDNHPLYGKLPLRVRELRSLARVRDPKKEDLERILSRRKQKG